MTAPFTLSELSAAAQLVQAEFAPTPQYCWPLLCEALGQQVWLKHENLTPTGAFKVRGGLVFMHDYTANRNSKTPKGLVTATRGNHGQSIPFAARRFGVAVTVLVPHGNSVEKNAAMAAWGADVQVVGQDFDEAREAAAALAEQQDLTFVPSYHPLLVRGVATYVLELLTAVPDLRTLYIPIGMGSGICAAIAVRDLLGLRTDIVGVVAAGADAMAQSFASGKPVSTDRATTFADGVATRVPNPDALACILAGAARVVCVSDDDIAAAIRLLFRSTHHVAEGAGAIALAAAQRELDESAAGHRQARHQGPIAVVLSGGNIDSEVFAQVLAGQTPVA